MIVACVDSCRQKIAGTRAERRYEFELPRAPDFALENRAQVAEGAFARAVFG
jgi:hypothetical protein